MTFIAFASAKGSPGVTTLSLLTAALWPRTSILADADVTGGDIAYQMIGESGQPLNTDRGLMSLLPIARKSLDAAVVPQHAQTLLGGIDLLAGLPEPEQAQAVEKLWPTIGRAFATLTSHDVLADLGSLRMSSPHLQLAREAEALVFVMRPRSTQVMHMRSRLQKLRDAMPGATPRFGIVVVAPQSDRRNAEAAVASLGEDVLRFTDYLGHVAVDPKGASMFEGQVLNRPERTVLVRSAVPVIENIAALAGITLDAGQVAAALGGKPAKPLPGAPKPSRKQRRGSSAPEAPAGTPGHSTPGPGAPAPAGYPAPQQPPASAPGTPPQSDSRPGTPRSGMPEGRVASAAPEPTVEIPRRPVGSPGRGAAPQPGTEPAPTEPPQPPAPPADRPMTRRERRGR